MKNGTFFFIASTFLLLFPRCTEPIDDPEGHYSLSTEDESFYKNKDKCMVCHYQEDNDTYKIKEISCGNALEAHLRHGDALPGDAVPGNKDYIFDDQCELMKVAVECPCFTKEEAHAVLLDQVNYCDGLGGAIGFFSASTESWVYYRNSTLHGEIINKCVFEQGTDPRIEMETHAEEKEACLKILQELYEEIPEDRLSDNQRNCFSFPIS